MGKKAPKKILQNINLGFSEKFEEPRLSKPEHGWREKLYTVVFEANTTAGKTFDTILVLLILSNIGIIMFESMEPYAVKYSTLFTVLDLTYTVLFTLEYVLRLVCVKKPLRYATSTYGIIDLLAILPSYLEMIWPSTRVLMIIRSFRLLRVFRIFKMVKFLHESRMLVFSLASSYRKIIVFLFFVLLLTIFLGSMMYVLEHNSNPGFKNIPQSIYWAVVTITTVGYGDIAPQTGMGKVLASFIMILGYAIIAVPTGLVSASFIKERTSVKRNEVDDTDHTVRCSHCLREGHDTDAEFCKYCGEDLAD